MPMTLTRRFTGAFDYAREHHAGDVRKGTTVPYLSHLLAVSAIVLEHGGTETHAIAALLHDIVEDGGGEATLAEIGERFGPDVAAIVQGCSDTTAAVKEDWRLRKDRYLNHLELATPDAMLVSAADKLHNARSISADLREHGDDLWARFNRGAQDQLWYYGALRDVFLRRLPGRLADELDRTVREINCLADPDDRIGLLGYACTFWSVQDSPESGAMVDWPDCPLVVHKENGRLAVRAEVGRNCLADYEDGDLDGLDTYLDVDLGDLRLEYREPSEVAWLVGDDCGDLREICETVAQLAPTVASQMIELKVMMCPPTTTYADMVANGPWFSASGPAVPRPALQWSEHSGGYWTGVGARDTHWEARDGGTDGPQRFSITVAHWVHLDWWVPTLEDANELAAEVDGRPPVPASEWVVDRAIVAPKTDEEDEPYATRTAPPAAASECGSTVPPQAVKPRRGSTDWWDDPSGFWKCTSCGAFRGGIDEPR